MLTLESQCLPVVGGGVLVSRTQPNLEMKYKRFGIIHIIKPSIIQTISQTTNDLKNSITCHLSQPLLLGS